MRVETNGLIFDPEHPKCHIEVTRSQGRTYAFITVVDTGMDGKQEFQKRYWGEYCPERPDVSLKEIMERGGKWPQLERT